MTSGQFEKIVHTSRDFITLIDRTYHYAFVNESYARELGVSITDILGKTVGEVWGEKKFNTRIKRRVDQCFEGKESHDVDQFKFGSDFKYIHVSYYPYLENGKVTYVMVFSHDVSVVKKLESKLLDFEFKDPTTGLFNRRSFDIVLDMEVEKAKRATGADGIRAVLFVNLRNISQINAAFGYELGNLLLEATALRIKDSLRSSDFVFRFDGKEFAVILTTLKRGTDIPIVAQNIRAKADFPYSYRGTVIDIACNIGAAVFPDDGDGKDSIVAHAMAAMNEAKEKNEPLVMFNKALHERGLYVARLRADIRTAFVEKQFRVLFQPIVDASGMIVGAEALIRWQHPELGNIPPDVFIPIAEDSGNIEMIGKWVLFQVCRDIRHMSAELGGRYISVNLSSKEFGNPDLVQNIRNLLRTTKISPGSLKLEITERQCMEDIESVIKKIDSLQALGVDVLIDDFGSGYSSLGYLKRLPARTIKVDKAFVDRIVEDEEDRAFIAGVIAMIGTKLRKVLVEGVGNIEQYHILRDLGVNFMQGYHFSMPRSAEEFHELLRHGEPLPEKAHPQNPVP